MSDAEYFKAISEQEPDFSATLCKGLSINDLSLVAIENMKVAYSKKQNNKNFLTQSAKQALIDLELLIGDELTYAALILLGKPKAIRKFLPQSAIQLEYRNKIGQIVFDKRTMVYKMVEIGFLESMGKGSGTKYIMGKEMEATQQVVARALQLGMEQMIKLGEVKKRDEEE